MLPVCIHSEMWCTKTSNLKTRTQKFLKFQTILKSHLVVSTLKRDAQNLRTISDQLETTSRLLPNACEFDGEKSCTGSMKLVMRKRCTIFVYLIVVKPTPLRCIMSGLAKFVVA